MKQPTKKLALLSLALALTLACECVSGFTFMKNWKLPGRRDVNRELAEEKFGGKKLVVITGTSSGLGRKTAQALIDTGKYHVIGAVRDLEKMKTVANDDGYGNSEDFTPMMCDLSSFDSVRDFCKNLHEFRITKPVDRLVCNAAISYDNSDALFSKDGHEQMMQTNFLSHFLMTSMLLDSMVDSQDAQVTLVGGSENKKFANLVNLDGFKTGLKDPVAMADGATSFSATKAFEDSKLCQHILTNYLHSKYHKLTGIRFNDFEARVGDEQGLFKVVNDASGAKSGITLTSQGYALVELKDEILDSKAYDIDAAFKLKEYANQITGAEWPKIRQVTSPCPTLKVIGAVTKGKLQREEMKRMRELGRPGISEPIEVLNPTKKQRVAAFVDKVATAVLKQTVGRVARVASKAMLGEFPEEALTGSFDEVSEDDVREIEFAIAEQLDKEKTKSDFGDKKLVVLTGASSGLGRKTALALLRSGDYHVIGAVRDIDKMEVVAELDGFNMDNFTPMYCELNSFDSVRAFCKSVDAFRGDKPVDRLICNAGVYQPSLRYAKWSKNGHEQTMQINFLSHFLMTSLLMKSMSGSTDPRVVMVGSVTGNDNTVGGGGVYPIADLHDLDGFKAGFNKPIEMADGYGFIGAKAYKDSKLCLMIMANFLHTKYNKLTGISFSSMYPGCIAESPLFREKRPWFRAFFPVFMKYITGGFVGEHEAGQRLFQVAHDPRCAKSGVYWSWNGGPREGRGAEALEKGGQISGGGGAGGGWDSIFENDQSSKVLNFDTGYDLFKYATDITYADWLDSECGKIQVTDVKQKVVKVVDGSTLVGVNGATTEQIGQSS